jgi:hypothetical protein
MPNFTGKRLGFLLNTLEVPHPIPGDEDAWCPNNISPYSSQASPTYKGRAPSYRVARRQRAERFVCSRGLLLFADRHRPRLEPTFPCRTDREVYFTRLKKTSHTTNVARSDCTFSACSYVHSHNKCKTRDLGIT